MTKQMVREAVAVFHSVEDMEAGIDELLTSGFDRAELSILASEATIEEKFDGKFRTVKELEDNPDAPSVAYLARESFGSLEGYSIGLPLYLGAIIGFVAVGGAAATTVLAAIVGAGGGAAIGGLLAGLIGQHHADFLDTQLRHGGILLWVRTRDSAHEQKAIDILKRHSADDVHVHGVPAKGDDKA